MLQRFDTPLADCDLKFEGFKNGQFEGYASTFNNVDSYGDTIIPGAFDDAVRAGPQAVKMFNQHNPLDPIGVWLKMEQDDIGLRVKGELTPGHTGAANVYALLRHGAISALSIGFRLPEGGYEERDDGGRNIKTVSLVEISPVSMPAEKTALIDTVKMDFTSLKDAELFLRESGVSRQMAVAFVSHVKEVAQSESDAILNDEIMKLRQRLAHYEAERIGAALDSLKSLVR